MPTGNFTVTVTNANGCSAFGSASLVSSSNEAQKILSFDLSPNPSTGEFLFALKLTKATRVMVCIYDATGRQILTEVQEAVTPQFNFDFSENPSGVYLLRAVVGEHTITKRLIIAL
ncbi:MAG: T9SS type A sorting domain-containing protein [Bacteroidetes bacterium]|nr:T9SS type A sorting domain-containing protein [Bacteroidota bacterium]